MVPSLLPSAIAYKLKITDVFLTQKGERQVEQVNFGTERLKPYAYYYTCYWGA